MVGGRRRQKFIIGRNGREAVPGRVRPHDLALEGIGGDRRIRVFEGTGRRRIEVVPEAPVDRLEDGAHAPTAAHNDGDAHERCLSDHTLRDAAELDVARDDAVWARAVLTRQLAHPGLDAEAAHRGHDEPGHGIEPPGDPGPRAGLRRHELDHERALVVRGGPASGRAQHRIEAENAGRDNRLRVRRPQRVQPAEGERRRRAVQAQRRGALARGGAVEQRVRQRELRRGAPRDGPAEEVQVHPGSAGSRNADLSRWHRFTPRPPR